MRNATVYPETSHVAAKALPPGSPLPRARGRGVGEKRGRYPLRVVIVDEELPYPPTSGKRIRTLNLALRLAHRHRLTFLCHRNADPDEARRAEDFLTRHGIEVVCVPRRVPPKSGMGFYTRLAANLVSSLPYSVATHNSAALRRALLDYAASHAVDLWHCEWTPYAEALRVLGPVRKLVMAHNVESSIWQRYHETTPEPLKRWYIGRQWRKFTIFERAAFAQATRTVAVSDADAALIRTRFGVRRVDVVDNGVDTTHFRPSDARRDPRQILFLGSLDWRPNLDAVALLLERVFPAVRAVEPAVRLCLVGRNPPAWLQRRVAGLPEVELHGNVQDVRPYLTGSGLLAVPLRIGGGSRLKILEALACGLPVVSTQVGAEGLALEPGRHLTVVETVDDMPAALLECMHARERAQAQAKRGRQVVLDRYDWDTLADRLEAVWFRCMEGERLW
jgi:polysaccharide biosynthesis protein PslH